jgi:hypothetical protein
MSSDNGQCAYNIVPSLANLSCYYWNVKSATLEASPIIQRTTPATIRNWQEQHIQPKGSKKKKGMVNIA